MYAILVLINLFLIPVAIVIPWVTITAFEAGRLAGWTMTLASFIVHAYVWYVMSRSSEALFSLGAMWATYEFVCISFAPLGVMEVEDKLAAAEAVANKG